MIETDKTRLCRLCTTSCLKCKVSERGPKYYNHSLVVELYNVGGISDYIERNVAFRRAGWKIKAHGESIAGSGGDRIEILKCMQVYLYIIDLVSEIIPYPGAGREEKVHPIHEMTLWDIQRAWDKIGLWRG